MEQLRRVLVFALWCGACGGGGKDLADLEPVDPTTAPRATVDRFSEAAGTHSVRTPTNGLPGPGEPIDFDLLFLHQGFGPNGEVVKYYDFDVQSDDPALMYIFFYEGEAAPIPNQLPIIDVIPGDPDYTDFWWITKVTVPREYKPNSITDVRQIAEYGLQTELLDAVANCPVVPEGSTALLRVDGDQPTPTGTLPFWYRGQIAPTFYFDEAELSVTADDLVPTARVYVTFNTNGDPSTGFMTEGDGVQTHNVVAALPSEQDYSPLWSAFVYDNAQFATVLDEASAEAATFLAENAELVNCPIVSIMP